MLPWTGIREKKLGVKVAQASRDRGLACESRNCTFQNSHARATGLGTFTDVPITSTTSNPPKAGGLFQNQNTQVKGPTTNRTGKDKVILLRLNH